MLSYITLQKCFIFINTMFISKDCLEVQNERNEYIFLKIGIIRFSYTI